MMEYRRETTIQSRIPVAGAATDLCSCQPLSLLHKIRSPEEDNSDAEQFVLATPELHAHLRSLLKNLFPRSTPLSILLLHISQLEHLPLSSEPMVLRKRQRYHAPESFLEQVIVNVGRAIRSYDRMLTHAGTGAAIIFPDVEQYGAYSILERVYHSINLLQAETVIPPLKHETNILMGIGSYPEPGTSLEHLLYHVSLMARRLTLRPAITTQLWEQKPARSSVETPAERAGSPPTGQARSSGIPYMQLPPKLPDRLKHLLPYKLALELHCVPVGRDHHCLTVAMADPTNVTAICHLKEMTGMIIFPVSCEVAQLDALLEKKW